MLFKNLKFLFHIINNFNQKKLIIKYPYEEKFWGTHTLDYHKYNPLFFLLFYLQSKQKVLQKIKQQQLRNNCGKSIAEQINSTFLQKIQLIAEWLIPNLNHKQVDYLLVYL